MAAFKRLRPATLLRKRLWHRRFLVNFVKFLRTPFLQNTFGRLLLYDRISSLDKIFLIAIENLQSDLKIALNWFKENQMVANPGKSQFMIQS